MAVNGALVCERFTDEQIRKTALDLLDIARQIEKDFANDGNVQDLAFRMKKISILLISYFQHPANPHPSSHT